MAEQNFAQAMRIADRGYVIVHGKIEFEGRSADELNDNDLIRKFISACERAFPRPSREEVRSKTARDFARAALYALKARALILCAFS